MARRRAAGDSDGDKVTLICHSDSASTAYGWIVPLAALLGVAGFVLGFWRKRRRLAVILMLASIAITIITVIWGLHKVTNTAPIKAQATQGVTLRAHRAAASASALVTGA